MYYPLGDFFCDAPPPHHSNKKFPHTSEGLFLSFPLAPFEALSRTTQRFFSFPLPSLISLSSLLSLSSLISLILRTQRVFLPRKRRTTAHITHICTQPLCACFCVFVRLTRAEGEDNPRWEGVSGYWRGGSCVTTRAFGRITRAGWGSI